MNIISRFSENKTRIHRWLFLTQILSPVIMYFGAKYHSPFLISLGLIGLVIASAIAVLTK